MDKNHSHGDQFRLTTDLCCFLSVTALKCNFSLNSGPCCLWRKAAEGSPALPTEHGPEFSCERDAAGLGSDSEAGAESRGWGNGEVPLLGLWGGNRPG